jgi:hypothetical protein
VGVAALGQSRPMQGTPDMNSFVNVMMVAERSSVLAVGSVQVSQWPAIDNSGRSLCENQRMIRPSSDKNIQQSVRGSSPAPAAKPRSTAITHATGLRMRSTAYSSSSNPASVDQPPRCWGREPARRLMSCATSERFATNCSQAFVAIWSRGRGNAIPICASTVLGAAERTITRSER